MLAERFASELDSTLSRFEEHLEAGNFWRGQFRNHPPASNIEIGIDQADTGPVERASQSFAIDLAAIHKASNDTGATPADLTLAAFSVLLS